MKTLTAVVLFALAASASAADVRHIAIDAASAGTPRDRFADLSVGSDYPGTLIRDDSLAQLKIAKDELGFRYIRFHAIFHDVLGTYKEVDGKPVYDWTKIDYLYDRLLKMGVKPFVELGFTPLAMRSSDLSIFYWKGNTSHPDPKKWAGLIDAFVRHMQERYGKEEVRTWFFEVWNEPNLDGFWEKADQKVYFELFDITSRTIKAIDPALRVGGPSTAGAAWVPEFLAHAKQSGSVVDFVTTHTYGVDGGFLDEHGKDDTKLSPSPDAVVGDVRKVRKEMVDAGHPDMPLYFTEWSTSYTPRDPVHDSYMSAPYILSKLKATEGLVQGMSYWTYSDLFEEPGPPTAPFEGGFGLMNPQGVRKPAWFAYKYLNQLGDTALKNADAQSYAAKDGRGVQVLAWDFQTPKQGRSNRGFFTTVQPTRDSAPISIDLKGLKPGAYSVKVYRTGFEANDAHTAYLKLGSPKTLSPRQLERLQALTTDLPQTSTVKVPASGVASVKVKMRVNDVVLIKINPQ
ncbi:MULTISPECIES: beta-xylosidase [unclassified Duganella]|jgi:xylan 1,4-beta-xylosidase|uniref:GH39 family glycosyl hydrolase n=1 Tax=unclassified Duganella TaxID=2636909 RepID=UPI000883FBA4|nr:MULTISPECIES: beta-xylosidase [unclassified Duganella]SDH07884.1 xylan 1,4-beta-xylosidase [Duganella sp. OV458]SDK18312.1 xylan 1,4-beta-xylosidase [Duganella sp. OV510]